MVERLGYDDLVGQALERITEMFPWDLEGSIGSGAAPLLIDVREPDEFLAGHIAGSMNVPRGLLEAACDYGFSETVPELVEARDKPVLVICRSGRRSALAALTLEAAGYADVASLKLGVKGWNDSEFPLIDGDGNPVFSDKAEIFLMPKISAEQIGPKVGI